MNYAMVNNKTSIVDNVIAWDGIAEYNPPSGYALVKIPDVIPTEPTPGSGWSYIDGAFIELITSELTAEDSPNVIVE